MMSNARHEMIIIKCQKMIAVVPFKHTPQFRNQRATHRPVLSSSGNLITTHRRNPIQAKQNKTRRVHPLGHTPRHRAEWTEEHARKEVDERLRQAGRGARGKKRERWYGGKNSRDAAGFSRASALNSCTWCHSRAIHRQFHREPSDQSANRVTFFSRSSDDVSATPLKWVLKSFSNIFCKLLFLNLDFFETVFLARKFWLRGEDQFT